MSVVVFTRVMEGGDVIDERLSRFPCDGGPRDRCSRRRRSEREARRAIGALRTLEKQADLRMGSRDDRLAFRVSRRRDGKRHYEVRCARNATLPLSTRSRRARPSHALRSRSLRFRISTAQRARRASSPYFRFGGEGLPSRARIRVYVSRSQLALPALFLRAP